MAEHPTDAPVDETAPGGAAPAGSAPDETLARLRRSIDNLDAALVHVLAERFRITQAVGEHKKRVGLPPADPDREQVQIARLRRLAESAGLDPTFTEQILRFIVDAVIRDYARIGVPTSDESA